MSSQRIRNIYKYVIPAMLSNVCFFLFTVVDGVFVGNGVGTNALGAVNIALPFIMAEWSLFMLAATGGVTISAIRIGRGDDKGANKAFMHSLIFTAVIGIIFASAGLFFPDTVCRLLGANDTFIDLASDYLFWTAVFIVPSGISQCLMGFCRNDGSPELVSVSVITSTACNILLDWLLIFPFKMGTTGAAVATGISQVIALVVVLPHFLHKKGKLRFCAPEIDASLFGKISLRGLPEGIAQLASPVMTLCMNLVLSSKIGDIGVNAFSVIAYLASFTLAVFFGTSEGLQPLFGLSYGAGNEKDLKFYFRVGMIINILGSSVIIAVILLFCRRICSIFGVDPTTLDYVVYAMPMYAWGFIAMSVNVIISVYLYSTKRSMYAIAINLLRSIAVSASVILILPEIFGANIVWYTFGIYESIVAVISVVLLKYSERNGIEFR